MSYALSAPLQAAVYQHLLADAGVAALVGADVYDAMPSGARPNTFVTLGPEEVRDASDKSGAGAVHRFTVTVISDTDGFARAKEIAGAVSDALLGADLSLSRGRLVGLWFEKARALRAGKARDLRRINLQFRARVEDA